MNDPTTPQSANLTSTPTPGSGDAASSTTAGVSWVTERNILREIGDRRTRAVLAILHARRSARTLVFFVPPQIAALYRLTPSDLCWALNALEGVVLTSVSETRGKFRKIRLLPQWEHQAAAEASVAAAKSTKTGPRKAKRQRSVLEGARPALLDPEIERTLMDLATGKTS